MVNIKVLVSVAVMEILIDACPVDLKYIVCGPIDKILISLMMKLSCPQLRISRDSGIKIAWEDNFVVLS